MVSFIAPDATFLGSALPRDLYLTAQRTALAGEYLMGASLADTRQNTAYPNAPQAAEALYPNTAPPLAYGPDAVTLGNGAAIRTGIAATPAMTIMVVTTFSMIDQAEGATSGAIIIGPDVANAAGRANVLIDKAGQPLQWRASVNGTTQPDLLLPATRPYTAPRAVAQRISGADAGATYKLDEFFAGTRTGVAVALAGARPAFAYGVQIGWSASLGSGDANFQARLPYYAALIWTRFLSDDDLAEQYRVLRAVMAQMGVAI